MPTALVAAAADDLPRPRRQAQRAQLHRVESIAFARARALASFE
jgi:hypothetical protein